MNYPPDHRKRSREMNVETVVKLIVMVCEVIKERSGGRGLEAKIADRALAEVAPMLPRSTRSTRALPAGNEGLLPRGSREGGPS
jgi:hypothetical protein